MKAVDTIKGFLSLIAPYTASLALLISVSQLINAWLKQQMKLTITPISKYFYDPENKPSVRLIYVVFENKSRLPISITSISLIGEPGEDGKPRVCNCTYPAQPFFWGAKKDNGEITFKETRNALEVPSNVMGLCAVGGVLLFSDVQRVLGIDATQAFLRVSTTRGLLETTLPLSDLQEWDTIWLS